jgi:hypothetical protein
MLLKPLFRGFFNALHSVYFTSQVNINNFEEGE